MRTITKFFLGIVFIGLLVLAFMMFGTYGDGYRAGSLTKVATNGVLFKTNEGELYVGTVINNEEGEPEAGGVINNIWYFSIKNDAALMKQLENALLNGHRVKLHYHKKYWRLFWVGDSKYIVDGVEILPPLPVK